MLPGNPASLLPGSPWQLKHSLTLSSEPWTWNHFQSLDVLRGVGWVDGGSGEGRALDAAGS